MTECQASPALACEPKCDPPQCEVRCPVEHCESGNCPECTTVCKKPRCHNVCQAAKVRNCCCARDFPRRHTAEADDRAGGFISSLAAATGLGIAASAARPQLAPIRPCGACFTAAAEVFQGWRGCRMGSCRRRARSRPRGRLCGLTFAAAVLGCAAQLLKGPRSEEPSACRCRSSPTAAVLSLPFLIHCVPHPLLARTPSSLRCRPPSARPPARSPSAHGAAASPTSAPAPSASCSASSASVAPSPATTTHCTALALPRLCTPLHPHRSQPPPASKLRSSPVLGAGALSRLLL